MFREPEENQVENVPQESRGGGEEEMEPVTMTEIAKNSNEVIAALQQLGVAE